MRNIFVKTLNENENIYRIEGEEFHHLKNVLRVKIGEKVCGFNMLGLSAELIIKEVKKNFLVAEATKFFKKEFKYNISIGIPLIKSKNFNFILKSIQQLGVCKIYPFVSKYSMRLNKIDKWNKILIESAKQSGNFYIPKIDKIYMLEDFSSFEGKKIVFYEKSDRFLDDKVIDGQERLLFLVGPEGGFAKEEIDFLKNNNFIDLKLKTNILRSEIAVITILSILKFLMGEV